MNTIIVAGPGRSGTTWVADIIDGCESFKYTFEPFNAKGAPHTGKSFKRVVYIRPDTKAIDNPQQVEELKHILHGTTPYNHWVFKKGPLGERPLVKSIKPMLIGWIKSLFPTVKVVLVTRHPGAIATSRVRRKWEYYAIPRDLIDNYLSGIDLSTTDPYSEHLLRACIDIYVPQQMLHPSEYHHVIYEEMCKDPEGTTKKMVKALGLKYPKKVDFKKPAWSTLDTKRGDRIKAGRPPISRWKEEVSMKQIEAAEALMKVFGL